MMKKLITLALIIGAITFIEAQSNLVFNQAIILQLSIAGATVPEGKIWKVTYGTGGSIFDVNGQSWSIGTLGSHKATPIWFPEGSVFTTTTSTSNSKVWVLNILEFNVVPISSSSSTSTSSTGFTSSTDFVGSGQYTTTNDYTVADSFTDIDGNEYGAINLNGNIWSSSDLKVTKFTDGTPIPLSTSIQDFQNTSKAAYFINGGTYLYNWQAIVGEHDGDRNTESKKLAPEGYRIPSRADWDIIIDFYGGEEKSSLYMMSKTGWPAGKNGINKSGLNLTNVNVRTYSNSYGDAWATNSIYYSPSGYDLFYSFALIETNSGFSNNGFQARVDQTYATNTSTTGVPTGFANNSGVAVRVIKEY